MNESKENTSKTQLPFIIKLGVGAAALAMAVGVVQIGDTFREALDQPRIEKASRSEQKQEVDVLEAALARIKEEKALLKKEKTELAGANLALKWENAVLEVKNASLEEQLQPQDPVDETEIVVEEPKEEIASEVDLALSKFEKLDNGLYDIIDLVNLYGLNWYDENITTTLEGKKCRWVTVPGDSYYKPGLLNMTTGEFEIPCGTYYNYSDEFKTLEGKICRKVSLPGDVYHAEGILNMTTGEFEIPCGTYYSYSDEFKTLEGKICRKVSLPGDVYFAEGILNMTTGEFEIPCKTYYSYSDEFKTSEGKICRWVSLPGDGYFAEGLLNMTTGELEIPCRTYVSLTEAEEDRDYEYIGQKENGTLDKLVYKLK